MQIYDRYIFHTLGALTRDVADKLQKTIWISNRQRNIECDICFKLDSE